MNNAIIISPADDVAVAIEAIPAGQPVEYGPAQTEALCAREDIPIYHKIAVRDLTAGQKICKYGEHIGEALCDIARGSHVHVHNVDSVREDLDNK